MDRDIDSMNKVLQKEAYSHVNAKGMTLSGFMHLQKLFIQRNRAENSWLVLRKFGYNNDLDLVLEERDVELQEHVRRDQSVELTLKALQFLSGVFNLFDKDQDGALNQEEFSRVFATFPSHVVPFQDQKMLYLSRSLASVGDFPNGVHTNGDGDITRRGWINMWVMTALLQPATALSYLVYLGYPDGLETAVRVTRRRKVRVDVVSWLLVWSYVIVYVYWSVY